MEGCITRQQFDTFSQQILEKSSQLLDTFQLRTHQLTNDNYLIRKSTILTHQPQENKHDENTALAQDLVSDWIETDDDSTAVVNSTTSLHYEHHICYSDSYNVPVMYFQAATLDGRVLSLEELWARVGECHSHALQEKWSLLTQAEHPYLLRPFYQLHPCHTQTFMRSLQCKDGVEGGASSGNYLLLWMSAIADVVGLHLSLEYFK